jgi:8-oxo-dGTP pyrophosphatase MutT (NUDIX family)
MHRRLLLNLLAAYAPATPDEAAKQQEITHFVQTHTDCFRRELAVGHITGSAWVTSSDSAQTLLTHHRKLDKWLQLGGHCDGDRDNDVLAVALREAEEESGIRGIVPKIPDIFDLDIHLIPERGTESAHLHYDIRFWLVADSAAPLRITQESKALRWVALDEVQHLTQEESIQHMVAKTRSSNR